MSAASKTRFRVLVVDDDVQALEAMRAVLSEDVDVTTCSSAESAMELLRRATFHVVCSDFRMPKMTGVELLQKVAESRASTGRLLITGAQEYVRTQTSGQNYVLLKPFDPEKLIRMVLQLARLAEMKRSVHSLEDVASLRDVPSSTPPKRERP